MEQILFSSLNGTTLWDKGYAVGTLTDLLVDDHSWRVRHLVAQTGSWFNRRERVVPAEALLGFDRDAHAIAVDWDQELAHGQEKCSTEPETQRLPVVQVQPATCGALGAWTFTALHTSGNTDPADEVYGICLKEDFVGREAIGGRSVRDILGYEIKATDGYCGSIQDVLLEQNGAQWAMSALVIRHGMWPAQQSVLLRPENVGWISWDEQCISVGLRREVILQGTPLEAVEGRESRCVI